MFNWEYISILWVLFLNCAVQDGYSCDVITKYTCKDETCITRARVCDGYRDCRNGEDEEECPFQGSCGQAGTNRIQLGKVVGSKDSRKNSWPWQVLITKRGTSPKQTLSDSHLLGGGSLLNKNWVLTAAHVFYSGEELLHISTFVISLGVHKRPLGNQAIEDSIQMYTLSSRHIHNGFQVPTYENDIALVKIGKRLTSSMSIADGDCGVTFSSSIRPVCLPCSGSFDENRLVDENGNLLIYRDMQFSEKCIIEENFLLKNNPSVILTGFGHLDIRKPGTYGRNLPKVLQQATLTLRDEKTCRLGIDEINGQARTRIRYSNTKICTNSSDPVDACQGDSGGPLTIEIRNDGSEQSTYVQVGIVSFGLGCGLKYPGYYTNVARYVQWIYAKMEQYEDFAKCGQARNVEAMANQATSLRFKRMVNGENANVGAWPWQALITRYSRTPEEVLRDTNLIGGGSILNRHWILTVAHVSALISGFLDNSPGWKNKLVISVGVVERPSRGGESVISTVQMYSIADFIKHEEFDRRHFSNDIALIKVGPKYNSRMTKDMQNVDGIEYGYFVRPVCLPCKNSCFMEKPRRPYTNDLMSPDEKCLEEEKLLLRTGTKVVATGYGHQYVVRRDIPPRINNLPKRLQQALLKIGNKTRCRQGLNAINKEVRQEIVTYTDKMICCVSGDSSKEMGPCRGDYGSPVVREVRDQNTGESRWIQIGITSFSLGCGRDDIPEYYTNVAKYVSWIDEKMQQTDAEL